MGLSIKVYTSSLPALKARLEKGCTRAEHIVALQAAKDTAKYVPMRTGSLRQRTRVVGNQIIYPGPYARYLYCGKLYVDPETSSPFARKGVTKVPATPARDLVFHTPGTRSHWFEYSAQQNMEKWARVAAKAVAHEL